ncbi:MAG: N-acetyl-gamma-glutamyl-phosphate reductase [Clostridia bacterium]|nr:N-acetyl-gamma-glutamyl-phosphate reductase [Clostridia bacterium]
MINVGIIGATGYAGYETLRILLSHPMFNVTCIVSKSFVGQKIAEIYPNLYNVCDLVCDELDYDIILGKADCFVVSLPHGASQEAVATLYKAGKKVVDLSADYRYENSSTYEKTYKLPHEYKDILEKAVYGLPELNREKIKKTSLVANPGCYPTCSILGVAPLLAEKLIDTSSIIIDAASGVTGAGRNQDLMYQFNECTENFMAYKIASHRHTTEIEEKLSDIAGKEVIVTFTPHLVPMKRGMMATIYATLNNAIDSEYIYNVYKEFYKGEYFVRIKNSDTLVVTKGVVASNFVDISIHIDKRTNRVIVISAIDNIGKGASSQAVQNMNLMYGLEETLGISQPGTYL